MAEWVKTMDPERKGIGDREVKCLPSTAVKEGHGIGILRLKEIIGMTPITPVPGTPRFIKGVIQFRWKSIPVVDLGLKFGMAEMIYTEQTCIFVLEIAVAKESVLMGIVVDPVLEVSIVSGADIVETPPFRLQPEASQIPRKAGTGE